MPMMNIFVIYNQLTFEFHTFVKFKNKKIFVERKLWSKLSKFSNSFEKVALFAKPKRIMF